MAELLDSFRNRRAKHIANVIGEGFQLERNLVLNALEGKRKQILT